MKKINEQDLALMVKATEAFEEIEHCTEAMKEDNLTDDERMMLIVKSMHLVSCVRRITSEALTDKELKMIKENMGDEWDMWKKANTPDGAIALLNLWREQPES